MRFLFVIVALAVIAVGLVKLRTDEVRARAEGQRAQAKLIGRQRETLWSQDVRLGELGSVSAGHLRAQEFGIRLVAPGEQAPLDPDGAFAYQP